MSYDPVEEAWPNPANTPTPSDGPVGSVESDGVSSVDNELSYIEELKREPVCMTYEWERAHETIDFDIICQPPEYVRAGHTLGRPIVVRSRSDDLVQDARDPRVSLLAQAILLRKSGQYEDGSTRWVNVSLHRGYYARAIVMPVERRRERRRGRRRTRTFEDWVYFVLPDVQTLQLTRPDEYQIDIEIVGSDLSYGRKTTRPFEVLPWRLPRWAVPESLELSKYFRSDFSLSVKGAVLPRPLLDTNSLYSR